MESPHFLLFEFESSQCCLCRGKGDSKMAKYAYLVYGWSFKAAAGPKIRLPSSNDREDPRIRWPYGYSNHASGSACSCGWTGSNLQLKIQTFIALSMFTTRQRY